MPILLRKDDDGIAHLTMNKPERLNTLSDDMLEALSTEFGKLAQDRSIRVIILSGAGKAFCAGHDLKEMTLVRQSPNAQSGHFKDLFKRCGEVMQMIPILPQPVIAQVHGVATAAGCQLVASCDLAVAADDTRFGVNGVNIGLFCSTPMVALTRNIPRKQAFEMLTTGDFINAPRAVELGLINRAVPTEDLERATNELAAKIAVKLASAVRRGKRAFYEQLQMPLAEAYECTGDVMTENMMDRDTAEGINAFVEKRSAKWRND